MHLLSFFPDLIMSVCLGCNPDHLISFRFPVQTYTFPQSQWVHQFLNFERGLLYTGNLGNFRSFGLSVDDVAKQFALLLLQGFTFSILVIISWHVFCIDHAHYYSNKSKTIHIFWIVDVVLYAFVKNLGISKI